MKADLSRRLVRHSQATAEAIEPANFLFDEEIVNFLEQI